MSKALADQRTSNGARARRPVRALPDGQVRPFEEVPELRHALSELEGARAEAARSLTVGSWLLHRGPWDPAENPPLGERDCGYLLLGGLLLSRVRVGSRCSADLLGPGDILRTDDRDTNGYETVASTESFRVLEPARIAVLDDRLMARIASLPGALSGLQRRRASRERSLRVRLAIAQVPRLTTRLELLLWHLADRWGRRCSDGARIPFRLSHEILAECVSARRSSVSTAIHELERRGALERSAEGHWVLRAQPPRELA